VIGVTAGLLAALVVAPVAPVADVPAPFELVWQAPAACPDGAEVLRRLATLAPGRAAPGLRADGSIAPVVGGTWRLQLALRGPGIADTRTIDAAECSTLGDVAALLLAIAVAPETAVRRHEAGASAPDDRPVLPLPPREPVAAPSIAAAPRIEPDELPTAPAPRRSAVLRGALRLAGGAEVGAIPAWSPSAVLGAALLGAGWRVELAGTYSARTLAYDDRSAVGGRLQLAAGALRGCGVPRWRRFEFPVCGGLELGALRGVARGVLAPAPALDLWIAAQLVAGAAWVPARRVALVVALDVSIALRRPGFHVASLGELARSQPIGLRPTVGVELRFP
jgi:hypothetical protein